QFLHLRVVATEQDDAPGEGNLVGRDNAVLNSLQQWKETAAPAKHSVHDLGAEGWRSSTPVGQEQRRCLRLSEAADGCDGSALEFLRLFRLEQAGECDPDALKVVEREESNGCGAGLELRPRIRGGLSGL